MSVQKPVLGIPPRRLRNRDALERSVEARLRVLEPEKLALVEVFIDQILKWHDPDVVEAFLAWRRDGRIGSILELAAELGDEGRDQLLFFAEDLYTEDWRRRRG